MNKKLLIIFISIVASIVAITPLIIQAQAQEENDRIFQKNFCSAEENMLSDVNYTNGEQLSYDSSGCPISTKIIHRWNEISFVDKNLIEIRMTSNGYVDTTENASSIHGGNNN